MEDNKNKDNIDIDINDNNKGNDNDNDKDKKYFTQADFDREISKMYEKFEAKFTKKSEQAKAEAEKLANMNAEEKLKYELEQKESQIALKEKEYTLKENKFECSKIFESKELPLSLVDLVVAEDAETMQKNIELLDKEYKKAIKKEVEKRLKGKAPIIADIDFNGITKEQFKKMSIAEQSQLYQTNRELYLQLVK